MQLFEYEKLHRDFVRKNLGECAVLLKSDGNIPIKSPCRIALFGSGARQTVMGGTGSGEVNSRYRVSAERGLLDAGFEIVDGDWLDGYDRVKTEAKASFIKEVKAEARRKHRLAVIEGMGSVCPEPDYEMNINYDAPLAVYVLARISGEGNDRVPEAGDIKLTASEIRDINLMASLYPLHILILNTGGPVDLSPIPGVKNILYLSQLGAETGNAVADLLLGKTYPSGKLSTTFAAWEDYSAYGSFGERDDAKYEEGIYVGYRYFDSAGKKPMFPFGFGLSYTSFSIETNDVKSKDGKVKISVRVKNVGAFRGKEVVEVYVRAPFGELDKPYQSLAAFEKTKELMPGESQDLCLEFDIRDLASYSEKREAYILDAGKYCITVGNSSDSQEAVLVLEITSLITVRQVKNLFAVDRGFRDLILEREVNEDYSDEIRYVRVESLSGCGKAALYTKEDEINKKAASLCDKELAYLTVGAHKGMGGVLSVIGNASTKVAGAAGETTSKLRKKLGEPLIMADGPAGVRLSPESYVDKRGAHSIGGGMLPETMTDYMPKPLVAILNLLGARRKPPKDKSKIIHRYATSLPVATAMANSFNKELAFSFGEIVGDEMVRFGINIWLAPAMNVHRNIRCGRNYEYYSEDPLLGGIMAASVATGVELHRGCGVCYKHFAANNQETNRYSNNSIVSERALREIYLRSFEIALKHHTPCAVMTSYNLLLGTHTAEYFELIHDYLRCECDYNGLVMTDWIVNLVMADKKSPYPKTRADRIIASDSDLIMPGARSDVKHILKALRRGTLDRKRLLASASRVINTMEMLHK